jgi:tetratricopeptide (TPR) repeat protein
MPFSRVLPAVAIGVLTAAPATARDDVRMAEQMRYQACIASAGDDAVAALQEAQTWRVEGGGWPAEVCEAHAFIALGEHTVGAGILEDLAGEARPGMVDPERTEFLTLAAESRSLAGEEDLAMRDYDAALAIDPDAVVALAGRARLNLARRDWPALERDANRLIDLVPWDATGWYLRGERRLNTGDPEGAWADMERARERAPDRVDILLLRGRINEARRRAVTD